MTISVVLFLLIHILLKNALPEWKQSCARSYALRQISRSSGQKHRRSLVLGAQALRNDFGEGGKTCRILVVIQICKLDQEGFRVALHDCQVVLIGLTLALGENLGC